MQQAIYIGAYNTPSSHSPHKHSAFRRQRNWWWCGGRARGLYRVCPAVYPSYNPTLPNRYVLYHTKCSCNEPAVRLSQRYGTVYRVLTAVIPETVRMLYTLPGLEPNPTMDSRVLPLHRASRGARSRADSVSPRVGPHLERMFVSLSHPTG